MITRNLGSLSALIAEARFIGQGKGPKFRSHEKVFFAVATRGCEVTSGALYW